MILANARVLTFDGENRVLDNAAVEIGEDGAIAAITSGPPGAPTVDLHGRLLMPALINCHTHLYSTLARGIPLPGAPPRNFRQILRSLWWRLDRALSLDDVYYSALVGLIDSAKNGVGTLIDHHSSPNACAGSLDRIADAFREVGLRGAACYETSDRNGARLAEAAIQENIRFLERPRDPLLGAAFGLHAAFTLRDRTLHRSAEAAAALDAPIHIHVAEDTCDAAAVERVAGAGLLGPRTLAAHCVHVTDRDMIALAARGASVVHNPQSNCNNAVGAARLTDLLRRGVTVGLGSDGYSPRLWDEFRTAAHVQKLRTHNPRVGYAEAYAAAFLTNREIVRRLWGMNVGRIEPGAAADLAVVDYYPPTPLTSENILGHLIFGISNAPVDSLYVNGRAIVQNRQCVTVDERAVAEKAARQAQSLWRRFESCQ